MSLPDETGTEAVVIEHGKARTQNRPNMNAYIAQKEENR